MAMDAGDIERLIKAAFPDAEVSITDLGATATIMPRPWCRKPFRGKSRVQQHQMVYAALQGNMGGVLHALR